MIQTRRHDRILAYVAQHELVTVEEAVELFGASPATIRRDFNQLADRDPVERIRGGIRMLPVGEMQPFALRQVSHVLEKQALARHAASLLREGDVAFVDGGTTTYQLAPHFPNVALRIITNSLSLVAALDDGRVNHSNIEVFLTGGFLFPRSGLLLGPSTQASLAQYHANWAILSAGGITEAGIFNTSELVIGVERLMVGNADRVVILADHSKIGRRTMCHVCDPDKIDLLITGDSPRSAPVLDRYRAAGVEVVTVPIPMNSNHAHHAGGG